MCPDDVEHSIDVGLEKLYRLSHKLFLGFWLEAKAVGEGVGCKVFSVALSLFSEVHQVVHLREDGLQVKPILLSHHHIVV